MSVPASCLHWQFPVFCVANVSYIIWENLKSDYLCIWLTLILIISCVGRVADLWKQCGSFCSWLQLIWETVTCSCFDCCFSLLKPLTCCQKQVKLLLLRQRPTLWLVLFIQSHQCGRDTFIKSFFNPWLWRKQERFYARWDVTVFLTTLHP